MKVLYTAEASVTGGREAGHGRTADGALDVQLRTPPELGGEGGGTNPEQLFAVGYAACFESALKTVARRQDLDAGDVRIDAKVALGPATAGRSALRSSSTSICRVGTPMRPPSSCAQRTSSARTRTPPAAMST